MTFQWWRWRKPEDQWAIEANRFGSEVVEADSGIHAEDAETFAAEVVPDIGALEGIAQMEDAEAFSQFVAPDLAVEDADRQQEAILAQSAENQIQDERVRQLRKEGLIRGSETDAPAAFASEPTPDALNAFPTEISGPSLEPTPDVRETETSRRLGVRRGPVTPDIEEAMHSLIDSEGRLRITSRDAGQLIGQIAGTAARLEFEGTSMQGFSDEDLTLITKDRLHPRHEEALQEGQRRLFMQGGGAPGVGPISALGRGLDFLNIQKNRALSQVGFETPVLGGAIQSARFDVETMLGKTDPEKFFLWDEQIELQRASSANVKRLEATLPPELVEHIDKTIGSSNAWNPYTREGALQELEDVGILMVNSFESVLYGMTPDPDRAKEDPNYWAEVAPDIDEVMEQLGAHLATQLPRELQRITDKYGIAGVEIVSRFFLDPLNAFGFGFFTKLARAPGIVGKILTPIGTAEMLYIKATDAVFKGMSAGFNKLVGSPLKTQAVKFADAVGGSFDSLLSAGDVGAGVRGGRFQIGAKEDVADLISRAAAGELDRVAPEFANVVKSSIPDQSVGPGGFSQSELEIRVQDMSPQQASAELRRYAELQFVAELEAGSVLKDPDILFQQLGLIGGYLRAIPQPVRKMIGMGALPARGVRRVVNVQSDYVNLPIARQTLMYPAYVPGNFFENLLFMAGVGVGPGRATPLEYAFMTRISGGRLPTILDTGGHVLANLGTGGKIGGFVKHYAGGALRKAGGPGNATADALGKIADGISRFSIRGGEMLEADLRRFTVKSKVNEGILNNAHLREWLEPFEWELRQALPDSMLPIADEIIESFRFAAVSSPDTLPELSAFYNGVTLSQKVLARIMNEYPTLNPAARSILERIAGGEVISPTAARKMMTNETLFWNADRIFSKPRALSDWLDSVEAMLVGIADLSPAELVDLQRTFAANRAHILMAARRAEGMVWEVADDAKRLKDFETPRLMNDELIEKTLPELDALADRAKAVWDANPLLQRPEFAVLFEDLSRIEAKYRSSGKLYAEQVRPAQEVASSTRGAAQPEAWRVAIKGKQLFYRRQHIEEDDLLRSLFPDLEFDPTAGLKLPEGAPTQRMMDTMMAEDLAVIDDVIRDLEHSGALQFSSADAQQFADGLRTIQRRMRDADPRRPQIIDTTARPVEPPTPGPAAVVPEVPIAGAVPEPPAAAAPGLRPGRAAGEVPPFAGERPPPPVGPPVVPTIHGGPEFRRGLLDKIEDAVTNSYEGAFLQYPGNTFDVTMRRFIPFWQYSSRIVPRMLRVGIQHPALLRMYEDYFNNTDQGYISMGETGIQVDPTRTSGLGRIGANSRVGRSFNPLAIPKAIADMVTGKNSWGDVVTPDKYPERHEGIFGDIQRMQDYMATFGLYPGASFELFFGAARAAMALDGPRPFDSAVREFELGTTAITSPMEIGMSLLETAGVDLGGLVGKVRQVGVNPFREVAINHRIADLVAQGVIENRFDPRARELAEQSIASEKLGEAAFGASRIRSPERLGQRHIENKAIGKVLGMSVREVEQARRDGDPRIATLLTDPLFRAQLDKLVGPEIRDARRVANLPLRGAAFQDAQVLRDERAVKLQAVDDKFAKDFQLLTEEMVMSEKAPIDLYRDYQEARGSIFDFYEPLLPTGVELRALSEELGSDPIKPSDLRIALNGLNGEPYLDDEGTWVSLKPESYAWFADGGIDWAWYFEDRQAFIDGLSPEIRAQLEEYRLLVDEDSIIPNIDQFRKAAEYQREIQLLPRYYTTLRAEGGGENFVPIAQEDQSRVRRYHSYMLTNASGQDVQDVSKFFSQRPDLFDPATLPGQKEFGQQAAMLDLMYRMLEGSPGNPDADPPIPPVPPRFPPEFGTQEEAMRIWHLLVGALLGDLDAERDIRETGVDPRAQYARRAEIDADPEARWRLPSGEDSKASVLDVIYDGVDPFRPTMNQEDYVKPGL